MAYPSYAQLTSSTEEIVDDLKFERATDGSGRSRVLFSAPKKRFTVKHRLVTADKATYETFYDTYRATVFDFVWSGDAVTYSCVFARPPRYVWQAGECEVEAVLEEV